MMDDPFKAFKQEKAKSKVSKSKSKTSSRNTYVPSTSEDQPEDENNYIDYDLLNPDLIN